MLEKISLLRNKIAAVRSSLAAKQSARRAEFVRARVDKIRKFAAIYHPNVEKALEALLQDTGDGFTQAHVYVSGQKYDKMLSLLSGYSEFIAEDADSLKESFRFYVYAFQLIDNIGQPASSIIQHIIAKYKISASNNALLAGALMATRNRGMAAAAAAEGIQSKYQAGAHNAEVCSVFTDGMGMMKFSVSSADLENRYALLIRTARRFVKFGIGESSIANRALFSLVFRGNHCRYEAPESDSKFVSCLGEEFWNNFLPYVWSENEAIAQLNGIVQKDGRGRQLASNQDLRDFMRTYFDFRDFLPAQKPT